MSGVKISRREALSTAAKIATTAVVAGVVAGVGGYLAGSSRVPAEKTVTETKTVTKMSTVTKPASAGATVTITKPPITETVTKTVTVGAPRPKPVVIRTISQVGGYGDPAIPLMNAFNKRYGKYIKVEYETAPYASKVEKIMASLIAKTDAYHMVPIITYYVAGAAPHLEDFKEYVEKFKDDPDWSVDLSAFPEGLLGLATWKGKLLGLPFRTLSHQILFYRKDLYEKHGLSPPKTIDDYVENARALNNPPEMYGASIKGRSGADLFEEFMAWMFAHGADVLNKEQNGTTPYPSDHSDIAERIIETWIEMDKEGLFPPGWMNFSALDELANYQAGRVAQYVELSVKAPLVEDPAKSKAAGKTGYILFLKDNPETVAPQKAIGILWSLCINKYCKTQEQKDAAYKLAVHMTLYESQLLGATLWANGPTRSDVITSEEYKRFNKGAEAHLDALKILYNWVIPQAPEAQTIICEEIHAALTKAKSVKDAVRDMWSRVGALFK